MANFTTENNTYCFRIGPAFLDTRTQAKMFKKRIKVCVLKMCKNN